MNDVEEHLRKFASVADQWFTDKTYVKKHFEFFKRFFLRENLESLEWKDVQQLGDHLHAMNSLAIAKKNAFGKPNHPIEFYRNTFKYLAYGEDTPEVRMRKVTSDPEYQISYFGPSCWSEIFGYVFSNEFVFQNKRSNFVVDFFGIDVPSERGDDFIGKFVKYNLALAPIIAAYREIVKPRTEFPLNIEIDQFFSWVYETKHGEESDKESTTWLISAGSDGKLWPEMKQRNFIAIGWDKLGNLLDYENREAIGNRLRQLYESESDQSHTSLACFEFSKTMKIGDRVIVKTGQKTLLALGEVASDYQFVSTRERYKNCRQVVWQKVGEWKVEEDHNLVTKTLTDISQYEGYPEQLIAMMEGGKSFSANERTNAEATTRTEIKYWWLNASPKYWDPREVPVGTTQTYTTFNEKGNKRRIYQYFLELRPGDKLVGYLTNPFQQVVCLFEVTKGVHVVNGKEIVEFKKVADASDPVTRMDLTSNPGLKDCEFTGQTGSLFKLSKEQFKLIEEMARPNSEGAGGRQNIATQRFTKEDALKDLFMPEYQLDDILLALENKKNVILQGPPGVGKTFSAKRIAYALIGKQAKAQVGFVQFHQSYSYEDFIQGIRPNGKVFECQDRIFLKFCQEAHRNPNEKYVFVIDEINRGNLSRIFGELLMLIEPDKRKPDYAVSLTYSDPEEGEDGEFFIPPNVYIIGTMNTADRGLALVDYALRRRFCFFTLEPAFRQKAFQNALKKSGATEDLVQLIVSRVTNLNKLIEADKRTLGPGFVIGHSYFLPPDGVKADREWFERIVKQEIESLLREYWFDNQDSVEDALKNLAA